MHVSSVSQHVAASSQQKHSAERANGAEFLLKVQEADADPVAAVMANYDLQNITPVEVDQLVGELRDAGHPFNHDLMMLSTRGAGFRSHLADVAGGAYDVHQSVNLVAFTQDQLTMARRHGDPTEALEQFLDFLKSFDESEEKPDTNGAQQRSVHESRMRQMFGASGA